MNRRDERHLAENEAIFKQINKDVEEFLLDIGVQNVVPVAFYCECSDMTCTGRIELSPAGYERIHTNPLQFVLMNGHENLTIEKIVEKMDAIVLSRSSGNLPPQKMLPIV